MFFLILIFDPNWPFCQGYSLCTMADFQNCLISLIFGIFSNGFLHRTTLVWVKNRFSHVFLNFNFWPKLTVLPRYSLCTMADFQNHLISRMLGVFSGGVLQRKTLMWLKNRSSHVFLNFNFWRKVTILPRLQPLHDGRFSKSCLFSNIWCFLKRFFAQNNSNVIKESFFACFSEF